MSKTKSPVRSLARAVSIVLHPFLTLSLAVAHAAGPALSAEDFKIVLFALGASLAAVGAFVLFQLWRGSISNIDVSKREQRPRFFAVAIASALTCAAVFRWFHLPDRVVIGSFISGGLLFASLIVNMWLKTSLHVAYTAFAVGIAWQGLPMTARLFTLLLVPLMIWSRVTMRRHTLQETIAGALLGTLASLAFNAI